MGSELFVGPGRVRQGRERRTTFHGTCTRTSDDRGSGDCLLEGMDDSCRSAVLAGLWARHSGAFHGGLAL